MTEKAVRDYNMIQENDKCLIGVSGGPDSLSLLDIFSQAPFLSDIKHSFVAVHVDLGFK